MIRAPRTLALLPASLLLASSLWGQKSEGRFWNWFQAHDSALFAVKTGNELICGELSEELHRVHPALTFEFGPVESGRREFVLSARWDQGCVSCSSCSGPCRSGTLSLDHHPVSPTPAGRHADLSRWAAARCPNRSIPCGTGW